MSNPPCIVRKILSKNRQGICLHSKTHRTMVNRAWKSVSNNTVEFDVLMYLSIMIKLFVCLKLFIVLLKSLLILLNNHLNGDVNITSEVLQIKILMLSAKKYNEWCLSFYVKNFILMAWQWWWYWHVFLCFFLRFPLWYLHFFYIFSCSDANCNQDEEDKDNG